MPFTRTRQEEKEQTKQLLWSCCINTQGFPGANIPCDLYMEHLNRRLQIMLQNLVPNVSYKNAGMAIAPGQHVCNSFEQQTALYLHSGHHSIPHFRKDFEKVLHTLITEMVFMPIREREFKHKCEKHSTEELKQKIEHSLKELNLSQFCHSN